MGDTVENNGKIQEFSRSRTILWVGILFTYAVLFSVTSYIAFFQEPYNPAADPSPDVLQQLQTEGALRDYFIAALETEGDAFKARKALAAQSFNVVLGALLGFLSASAVQSSAKRRER